MKNALLILSVLCLTGLSAAFVGAETPSPSPQRGVAVPIIAPAALRAHIAFLADDTLRGREAGSDGYRIAANYVATQFRLLGLDPAGDENGGFFQSVPLMESRPVGQASALVIEGNSGRKAFTVNEDYLISSNPEQADSEIRAPVIFAGFGIAAPERGHDDYAGIDARGKIVAYLMGAPKAWPSEIRAHYGSARQKLATASAAGAIGIIQLYTPTASKQRSFERRRDSADKPGVSWVGRNGAPHRSGPGLQVIATVNMTTGAQLFGNAPETFQAVIEAAEKADATPPAFPLDIVATMRQKSEHRRMESPNVAALFEGSDPVLKEEYLLYTAHLDHIGISTPVNGDAINNGALDNAAGIATLIEIARAFKESGTPPRRSILFLAVTAEEKGLIGSDYFAHHPTVPLGNIVANVNLDMPLILHPIADVIAFGAEHSTLGPVVGRAARKVGLAQTPDPIPDLSVFVRSDHYDFVLKGVPAVSLFPGFKSRDPDADGEKIFWDFMRNHYHRPSDDISLPIDYEAGALFARINYLVGLEVTTATPRPRWVEGDFFGEKYAP